MKERNDGLVKIDHVSDQILGRIIEFLYSGEISMTSENNKEFYMAADFLMIESKCWLTAYWVRQSSSEKKWKTVFIFQILPIFDSERLNLFHATKPRFH